MKTIETYTTAKHELFTHELVQVGNIVYPVYKNKGYAGKSTTYGVVFEINTKKGGNENIVKFKTQKQVVSYLSKL